MFDLFRNHIVGFPMRWLICSLYSQQCFFYHFSIVCVGGDGIFSEVLNGLLNRTLREADIAQVKGHQPISPNIRIGLIPAGNSVRKCSLCISWGF